MRELAGSCNSDQIMALKPPSRMLLRVDPRTVVIFGAMLSPALFVAGHLSWQGRQLREAAALCVLYALGVYWMCGRTVELAPGRLIYRVLFVRKVIDITSVDGQDRPVMDG